MALDLKQTLKKLNDDLEKNQQEMVKLSKRTDSLTKDLHNLEEIKAEVEQTSAHYNQSFDALSKKEKDIKSYLEMKEKMISDRVLNKKKKDQVNGIRSKYDVEMSNIEKEIANKEKNYKKKQNEYEVLEQAVEQKKKSYEDLRNYQNTISRQLQELYSIKENTEKEEENKKIANVYSLIEELKDALNKISIKTKKSFQEGLVKSWQDLQKAKQDLRKKMENLDMAKNELTGKQVELESLKKDRLSKILEETGKIKS